jgi:DNA-damage-inducible protein J
MKTTMIHARVEPDLKHEAEAILKQLGLNTTQAVTLFFQQVRLRKGLPFEVKLPNDETETALRDVLAGKNLEPFSLDELTKEIRG